MKYITKKIFLDSNIYEGNNFFYGNNIRSLLHYSKIGLIKLYMTEISRMELLDRMKKNLIDVKSKHNDLVRYINKTRILKNLSCYEAIDYTQMNVSDSLKELAGVLNTNISTSNIEIISSDRVNPDAIFKLYYNNLPPFSSKEKKKYEFPDAFIISSINQWCIDNKSKMIFVTKDRILMDTKVVG